MDLRCPNKMHGVLIKSTQDDGLVEVKCISRWCGAGPGVVVTHQFSTRTGKLVSTQRFRQPPTRKE